MTTLAPKKEYALPDTSRLKFTEKGHYYELDGKKLTGVTSVIDGTSSKDNLIGWAANMAVDYVKENSEKVRYANMTPATEYERYHIAPEVLEEARTAHTRRRDKAASKGTDVHALVEEYILACIEQTNGRPLTTVLYPQIQPFAYWAQQNVDRFLAAEQRLYSETHALAGTADFVAIMSGKLTIGDLKSFPVQWDIGPFHQAAAYALMFQELTGQKAEQTVVVKMCDPSDERLRKYKAKPFAAYYRYSIDEDIDGFLSRLKLYRQYQNYKVPIEV